MRSTIRWVLAALSVSGFSSALHAEDFYKGKQLKLIVGTAAGGSYDLAGRLLGRHITRHIPGNPNLIVQNMPGASSLNAMNYIYNIAPQDGTILGVVVQLIPQYYLFKEPGVRYDPSKINWIGNFNSSVNVYAVSSNVVISDISEIFQKPIIFGASNRTGSGGADVLLTNNVLGTKFELITGYKGGADIDLALERGEVQGRAAQSWDGWKSTRPDWVRNGKIKVLMQVGLKRDPELGSVPLITELAKTEEQKAILNLFSSTVAFGRPLVVGPGVQSEQVETLRKTFASLMKDPQFVKDANTNNFEVSPVLGADLQRIVNEMLEVPSETVKKAQDAMSK